MRRPLSSSLTTPGHWLGLVLLLCALGSLAFGQEDERSTQEKRGQELFGSTCAACHGLDGQGGEHAPGIGAGSHAQTISQQALEQVVRKGIPSAGMPGFEKSFDEPQLKSVLAYLRLLQQRPAKSLQGKAANGRTIFFGRGGCSGCHAIAGAGGFFAPELSSYGRSHSAEVIREWITDPKKSAAESGRSVEVITREGVKYVGLLRNEDNFSIQMQTSDGAFHLFHKSQLARFEKSPVPLMPANYGKALTRAELDDLVSFLMSAPGAAAGKTTEEEQ